MNPPVGEGTGQPGSKQLEGPQTPAIDDPEDRPAEIQVGKPAKFQVTVRNTGRRGRQRRRDSRRGAQGHAVVATTPRARAARGGELVWTLGTIQPGEEATVEIELMPTDEGEIGSVATVRFDAEASARRWPPSPQLEVEDRRPASQVAHRREDRR